MYSVSFTTKIVLKHICIQFPSPQESLYHEVSRDVQGTLSTDITTPEPEQQTFSQMAERAPLEPAVSNTLLFSIRTNHL